MERFKKVGKKILQSDNLAYTFIRSVASSQTASWVDLFLGFALFSWVGLPAWLATGIGAVAGGIINCIINYKFTFHADGCPWRAVAVKYALVWIGSLLLNSLGTEGLYELIKRWQWLADIGFDDKGYYAAARLIVSLLVSWFWNFVLQRYFVYRPSKFDRYAIRAVNFFSPGHNDEDSEK